MGGPMGSVTTQEIKFAGDNGIYFLRRRMDNVGDGSGIKNMAAAADEYFLVPGATDDLIINTIRIVMQDVGDFPWNEFAATGGALATGCSFKVKTLDNDVLNDLIDFMDGDTITLNSQFLSLGNTTLVEDPAGISVLTCDIDFNVLLGYPLRLHGNRGQLLSFEVADNLAGLTSLEIWVHGMMGSI